MSDLIVYGTTTCADCNRTKDYLDSRKISYQYIDIASSDEASKQMLRLTNGSRTIPVILKDGKIVQEPTNKQLKEFLKDE